MRAYFEPTEDEREQGLKLPTVAHRAIASLVARGYVRVILTTNFDRLLELALEAEGVVPTVIATPDAVEGALPAAHACSVIAPSRALTRSRSALRDKHCLGLTA